MKALQAECRDSNVLLFGGNSISISGRPLTGREVVKKLVTS
jgi:hypothetical protein